MAKHHGRVNSLQRPNLTWKGAWTSSDNNFALNDFWLSDFFLKIELRFGLVWWVILSAIEVGFVYLHENLICFKEPSVINDTKQDSWLAQRDFSFVF
jgi:hypothetical protein